MTADTATPEMSLEELLLELRRGEWRIMRRVMAMFWSVRNKFSPYVENGKAFRAEYASVIAYESVSRM